MEGKQLVNYHSNFDPNRKLEDLFRIQRIRRANLYSSDFSIHLSFVFKLTSCTVFPIVNNLYLLKLLEERYTGVQKKIHPIPI